MAISPTKIDYKSFERNLKELPQYKSFYFIDNKKIVNQRIAKAKVNTNKIIKTIKIAQKLKLIPTIKFIGISGSLSMKSARENDDIDLFIITEKRLVWFTRLISISVLSIFGLYRRKNDIDVKNKICLNFLIDKNNLKFKTKKQNLYTAHEIVQLLPLFEKDGVYFDFINKNKWVGNFLPNFRERVNKYQIFSYNTTAIDKLFIGLFNILQLESLAKVLQFTYMKKDITIEEIRDGFLAFHPINYENNTLSKLNLRMKNKRL